MENQIYEDALNAGMIGPRDRFTDQHLEHLKKFAALVRGRAIRREISDRLSYRLGLNDGRKSELLYRLLTDKINALVKAQPDEYSVEGFLLDKLCGIIHEYWVKTAKKLAAQE